MRCLDCGNKAKRDCLYYRCRSCCKGHGFHCQTHVKSTWVPISTRQMVMRDSVAATVAPQQHHRQQEQLHLSSEPSSSSGFGGNFPAEVTGEAAFTCVRVTTTSKANAHVDQYAYETSINITGHVFRGVLYDQGPHDTPMVTSSYLNVHEGDQHISTINVNVPYNLQLVNNPRSSAPPTLVNT